MGQRLRNIEIDYVVLAGMLQGHPMTEVTTDVPADIEILGIHTDIDTRRAVLTVRSTTFDELPYGARIPTFNPSMTVKTTEMAMLADLISKRHDFCKHCGEPLADDA